MRPARRDPGRERLDRLRRIHAVVDSIPRGSVATYGQVAREAGLPRHARLVGRALGNLPQGTELPWHRVVNARGEISTRTCDSGGERTQLARLKREGVEPNERGRIDLARFGWRPE